MLRFLHAADIHLDSPLKGLAKKEYLPVEVIRSATRQAFTNLVQLALDEKVDFVILAGDLYDRELDDKNSSFFFNDQVYRLKTAGIPVVMISGNHDAVALRKNALPFPENVKVLKFREPEVYPIQKNGSIVAIIYGQSFGEREERDNIALKYPAPQKGAINIGLLHTSMEGSSDHDPYAPTSCGELVNKGYDYWALGHIHKREVICQNPPIVYPGNIQGRHIRETGPKGCYLVSFNNSDTPTLEFKELDVFRWATMGVDLSGAEDEGAIKGLLKAALEAAEIFDTPVPMGIRITYKGKTPLHSRLISQEKLAKERCQDILNSLARGKFFVEKLEIGTAPPSENKAYEAGSFEDARALLKQTIQYFRNLSLEDLKVALDPSGLSTLEGKIPGEWTDAHDPNAVRVNDQNWLEPLWDKILPLIERLAQEGRNQS